MSATVEMRLDEKDEIAVSERSVFGNVKENLLLRIRSGDAKVEFITSEAALQKLVAAIGALESRRLATAIEKAKEAVEEARRLGADVALAEPAGAATVAVEGGA